MDNSDSLMEVVRCMMETNRNMYENQKRILQYLEGMDKRIQILEMTTTSNETIATKETSAEKQVGNFQQLSQDIKNMESRLEILETKLKHVGQDLNDSEITRTEGEVTTHDKQDVFDGIMQNVDSLSMGSWSDNESSLKKQPDNGSFPRKGSFKAASLAIVFVNRLTIQAPNPVQPVQSDTLAVRSGGENLKRAVLAVIFMIKLMKALNLPRVIEQNQDINPD